LIFSLLTLFEAWTIPVVGYLFDRLGIRKLTPLGMLGILLGWLFARGLGSTQFGGATTRGALAETGAALIYAATVA
jgi:MFS family permease